MFWVPGLSLVIFFLVMIPLIIYGSRKGWVYALTFSITLWLVTLVFVGINYAIYKYLWKVFHFLILEKNTKVVMNLDSLSNFYKTQVVLFAIGLEFILIYPITFLLMHLNNKYIKKYFGHKVRSISMSAKEIIYKRNIKISRIIGTAIITTTALFSASLLASAVNGITTPYKKSNFANSINDSIGKIYSFGLAKNSKSSQIISTFIGEDLDDRIATSMRELVNFSSSEEQPNNVFPNIKEIHYLESQIQKFKELFKNDKATKAIFTSVIRQARKTLNPFLFDDNITTSNQDANLNTIGYNKRAYLNNLEALEKYVVDNKIKIPFKEILIDVLVKKIEKSFVTFKDTIFYKNYNEAVKKRNNHNEALNKKIDRNRKLQGDLKDFKIIRRQLISKLIKISGGKVIQGDPESNEEVSFPIERVSRAIPRDGTFQEEVIKENTKRDFEQTQLNNKNTKVENYDNYKGRTYDSEKRKVDEAAEQYNEAKGELEILNQEKANLEQISAKKVEIDSKKTKLDSQERVFIPFKREEARLKRIRNDAISRHEQALKDYLLQKNKVDSLKNEYETTIGGLQTKNEEIISANKAISDLGVKKDELVFMSPAKKWNKNDDGSIFYHQELIKFSNNKIQQLQTINIDKEARFKILKNRITSLYREWLDG